MAANNVNTIQDIGVSPSNTEPPALVRQVVVMPTLLLGLGSQVRQVGNIDPSPLALLFLFVRRSSRPV